MEMMMTAATMMMTITSTHQKKCRMSHWRVTYVSDTFFGEYEYGGDDDDKNNGSNKEQNLNKDESEDAYEDKDKEKDELMPGDTPPKAL